MQNKNNLQRQCNPNLIQKHFFLETDKQLAWDVSVHCEYVDSHWLFNLPWRMARWDRAGQEIQAEVQEQKDGIRRGARCLPKEQDTRVPLVRH